MRQPPLVLSGLDPDQLDAAIAGLRPGIVDIDARGMRISQNLLERIFSAVECPRHGAITLGKVNFESANFVDKVEFPVDFYGEANFYKSRFAADAIFEDSLFKGAANFEHAWFEGWADFAAVTFEGGASFENATFNGYEAFFAEAEFGGGVWFGVDYDDGITEPTGAYFNGQATFANADLENASFEGVNFASVVDFRKSSGKNLSFARAKFEDSISLGPMELRNTIILSEAVFSKPVVIESCSAEFLCVSTKFEESATMRLCSAKVDMERATFGSRSTIEAAQAPGRGMEDIHTGKASPLRACGAPSLMSLRGVNTADLLIVGVNMEFCDFDGAHQLDKISMEGVCHFGRTPTGVRFGLTWPPAWVWSRRQLIAEERTWRSGTPKHAGWSNDAKTSDAIALPPRQISALYRQLRKAHEDSKNEPGAADFYYGEMEMRRHSSASIGDWLVLNLYWLISGYGLRALRTLGSLVVLLVVAGFLLHWVGCVPPRPISATIPSVLTASAPSVGLSILYAAQSAVPLSPPSGFPPLTWQGEIIRLFLRLLGPLLIGLTLLAIRNRVKR